MLQRHGPAPAVPLLADLMREADADVRAAAVFAAGVQGAKAAAVAAAGLKDLSPLVQRRAAEALVRMGQSPSAESLAPVGDLYALLGSPDRFVRFAGRLALQRTARAAWRDRVLADTHTVRGLEAMVAYIFTAPDRADLLPLVDRQIALDGPLRSLGRPAGAPAARLPARRHRSGAPDAAAAARQRPARRPGRLPGADDHRRRSRRGAPAAGAPAADRAGSRRPTSA